MLGKLREIIPTWSFWDREAQKKARFAWVPAVLIAAVINDLVEPYRPATWLWDVLELAHVYVWYGLSLGLLERYVRRKALERAMEPKAVTDGQP